MSNYIAIGDIHGMSSMLDQLLLMLPLEGILVFLGDYIDRGPDSKGVISRLLELQQARECIFLRGNHEEMCLSALSHDRVMMRTWMNNGGLEVIKNYDGSPFLEHLDFLRATRLYYETDEFIFVHAGLMPGLPLHENGAQDCLWIRDVFLNSQYNWGKLIIHGHTPNPNFQPQIQSNRINIDTGAVFGGMLTAIVLPERRLISVDHPDVLR